MDVNPGPGVGVLSRYKIKFSNIINLHGTLKILRWPRLALILLLFVCEMKASPKHHVRQLQLTG